MSNIMGRDTMEGKVVEVQAAWREGAHVDDIKYRKMYAASVADPDAFWAETASASIG